MLKVCILLSSLLTLAACSKPYERMQQLTWMEGEWHSKMQGKEIIEKWKLEDDSTLVGTSYFVKELDTLLSENMTISIRNGDLCFNAQVSDQNDGETVPFKVLKMEEKKVHFENLLHDFPQQIVYYSTTKDSLAAYIDGNLNGNYERIDFRMKRLK